MRLLKSDYNKIFLFISLLFIVEFFLLRNTPFFWDAVSKSLRARWFYDNNFSQWVVPTEINSGHPPLWTLILSAWWKLFGLTLISSRFLLLIINILVAYQVVILFKNSINSSISLFFILLIFIEPTFLAQTTILNNDMLLLLFTVMGYNFISGPNKVNRVLYTVILIGILFSNLRGMLIFSCLFLVDILFLKFKLRSSENKFSIVPYGISLIVLGLFFIYQYSLLGWIIKTPSPNWNGQRNSADFFHILKNIASVIRNFFDYGRIVIILLIIVLLFRYFIKGVSNKGISKLLISFFVFSFGLSVLFIFFTNPIGHRYYIFAYIISVLLFIELVNTVLDSKKIKIYVALVFLAFVTGHLWIYPSTISQGWDSSLAYLNYFPLREDVTDYIEKNKIDRQDIGTNLPLNSVKHSDLLLDEIQQKKFTSLNLNINKYVILSNIENATSDEDINTLFNDWIEVKSYNKMGIYVTLFKNPNN